MFPLRDDNPTLLTPIITIILILVNVGVWIYVQGAGVSPAVLNRTVCSLGMIPAEVTGMTGGYTGVQLGPGGSCLFGGITVGAIFTSMFLHGGWVHLIGNMWFLWLFGNNVEDSMGHLRFLVFYLLVGVGAAAAHVFIGPESPIPTVGASGAISGVMGAYLLLYPRVRIQTLFWFLIFIRIIPVPAWFVLILWFGLQLLSGYTDTVGQAGVAFWAHVGGFVAGVVLIKLFVNRQLLSARRAGQVLDINEIRHRGWL